MEGTKVTLDVNGELFVAKGDVLVKPGFRAIYPYGLKKDEQLPALSEGARIAFNGAVCSKKQTEPPARYSQGKLIQEMEKLGLGTKSTRHAIIERLYTVKYIQNDPIEPSQLGMAVCDALDKFAPHITHPEMTAELEEEMDNIAEGRTTKDAVVSTSRNLLAEQLASLLPHSEEVKDALADAVAADAYVGPCPKCGKDLQLRASQKTRGMFIGCAGWPDCDVTYPLPKGKVEAVPEKCPVCGMPQVKVTAFRSKPRTVCIDPNCATNKEPDVVVGECPACKAAGRKANLVAQKNPRTLKRFIHCENYDECGTGYPLPSTASSRPRGRCASTAARRSWSSPPRAGRGGSAPTSTAPAKSRTARRRPARRRPRAADARPRQEGAREGGAESVGQGGFPEVLAPPSVAPLALLFVFGPVAAFLRAGPFSSRAPLPFALFSFASARGRSPARWPDGGLPNRRSLPLSPSFSPFLAAFASSLRLFSGLPERVSSSVARSRRALVRGICRRAVRHAARRPLRTARGSSRIGRLVRRAFAPSFPVLRSLR